MNQQLSITHAGTTDPPAQPAAWGAVCALAFGAFVLVATEFMPVSLLTPIAADIAITEGQTGHAIAISGAFSLLSSLHTARLAGRLDRKVLSLTLLMMASGALAALAANYFLFMVGRALFGVAIGGFWLPATAVLLGVWGLIATAAPLGWWMWPATTLPKDAKAGGVLMVAAVQLAIMLGALVGGVLFDASGYRATFSFSAGLLLVRTLLAVLAARAGHTRY